MGLTLLVVGDPGADYLQPLSGLPNDTRVTITNDRSCLFELAPEADVLLNGDFSKPALFLETFPRATRIRWAHSVSAGVERILSPEITASPVPLTNGRGQFADALGEWIVAAMLHFAYGFRRLVAQQEQGRWQQFDHPWLYGHTLGVVGYGSIGRAAAERARAFRMKIVATRRNPSTDPLVDEMYEPARIREMLARCDYVAITAPLTAETRGMIGAAELDAMKPDAVLINVGRGAVVEEAALLDALRTKKIGGAALDVFATEPLPAGHPFYSLEHVLLSPHSADHVPNSRERAVEFFVENFKRFRDGQPLQNVVNKHAGY
jgi:phosphoglycerate dehydrogenase-like enzyme